MGLHRPPCGGLYRNSTDKAESITHSTNSCCSDSEVDDLDRIGKIDTQTPMRISQPNTSLIYGKRNLKAIK